LRDRLTILAKLLSTAKEDKHKPSTSSADLKRGQKSFIPNSAGNSNVGYKDSNEVKALSFIPRAGVSTAGVQKDQPSNGNKSKTFCNKGKQNANGDASRNALSESGGISTVLSPSISRSDDARIDGRNFSIDLNHSSDAPVASRNVHNDSKAVALLNPTKGGSSKQAYIRKEFNFPYWIDTMTVDELLTLAGKQAFIKQMYDAIKQWNADQWQIKISERAFRRPHFSLRGSNISETTMTLALQQVMSLVESLVSSEVDSTLSKLLHTNWWQEQTRKQFKYSESIQVPKSTEVMKSEVVSSFIGRLGNRFDFEKLKAHYKCSIIICEYNDNVTVVSETEDSLERVVNIVKWRLDQVFSSRRGQAEVNEAGISRSERGRSVSRSSVDSSQLETGRVGVIQSKRGRSKSVSRGTYLKKVKSDVIAEATVKFSFPSWVSSALAKECLESKKFKDTCDDSIKEFGVSITPLWKSIMIRGSDYSILDEVKGKLQHVIVSGIQNPDFRTAVFMHWKDSKRNFKFSRDIHVPVSEDHVDTEQLLATFICSKRFSLDDFIRDNKCWVFIDCKSLTVRANDKQVVEEASKHVQGRISSIFEHTLRRCINC